MSSPSSFSSSSAIPQIWRNISPAGNLQRKRDIGFAASTSSNGAGEASASNRDEFQAPIPRAALRNFSINVQGSRFVEDVSTLVAADQEAAGPSSRRASSISFIENTELRPAERQPPSRPRTPYIERPATPMGESRVGFCHEAWTAWYEEASDAARACRHWVREFRAIRQEYELEFYGVFNHKLERISIFRFKYWRFAMTIAAVERTLDSLASLILLVDGCDVHDDISALVDFFSVWIVEAYACYNAMTNDRAPVDLDNAQERAERKGLMEQKGPEISRLTGELSANAQKPLKVLQAALKEDFWGGRVWGCP
ncbi:uncharacterized protein Z520_06818 [Fonsecaea multimorphosa CBS 102226]|uniref:Uncharacterized protein n=1 Tax=Fonsecaea multimorphosa CBS 102226 TaxID=1442371 RepID=A0A0D2IJX6_9EURO|nr:uncharacterized protein Z520_06818 [Fonsecaea multimorphosa CBS 102226]KIX97366.1 hypothetical protein Z520_06818 [Fonsecaea multimorphosa CBS 102226]OAL23333.1 hypothetical protein AYO22_06383 [Fonsecaea multimorphosa]